MNVGSVFVTNANWGIGLEMVRQLIRLPKPPKHVFATYRDRNTAHELMELKDSLTECEVNIIKMNVHIPKHVKAARKIVEDTVGENGLNLLINNAGALKMERFPAVTYDNMLFHFQNNTLGPITVLKEMLPLLQKASSRQSSGLGVSRATVLNISCLGASCSSMDDLISREDLGVMGFFMSKAALNMAMRVITQEVKHLGILVVLMCPGWEKTLMGSEAALIHLSESVSDILRTCPLLNETHQGSFINRFGNPIPF